jgi:hypothetical protein
MFEAQAKREFCYRSACCNYDKRFGLLGIEHPKLIFEYPINAGVASIWVQQVSRVHLPLYLRKFVCPLCFPNPHQTYSAPNVGGHQYPRSANTTKLDRRNRSSSTDVRRERRSLHVRTSQDLNQLFLIRKVIGIETKDHRTIISISRLKSNKSA